MGIVAKFLIYLDKGYNRKLAYLTKARLKGTKIGIADQLPEEIADARKKLYPIMKKAKNEGNTVKLIKDRAKTNSL